MKPQPKQKKSQKKSAKQPSKSKNAARAVSVRPNAPLAYGNQWNMLKSKRMTMMPLSHCEPVLQVDGTAADSFRTISLNPGLASSAPWASQVAQAFENYEVRGFKVHYAPRSSASTSGRIVVGIDYDATDPAPATFAQIANYDDSFVSNAWEPFTLVSKRANLMNLKKRYVRDEPSVADQDLRFTDLGKLYVFTTGCSVTSAIGDIFIEWDIVLSTPQIRESSFGVLGGYFAGGGTLSGANPLGTVPVPDSGNRGVSLSAASRITFNEPGVYLVQLSTVGTGLSTISFTAGSSCSTTAIIGTLINGATTTSNKTNYVTVNTADVNAYLDIAQTATTITASACLVSSVPYYSPPLLDLIKDGFRTNNNCRKFLLREKCLKAGHPIPKEIACRDDCECGGFVLL